MEELLEAVGQLAELRLRVVSLLARELPVGCFVTVLQPGHCGIVVQDPNCLGGQVPILFENGNVWWKPVAWLTRVRDLRKVPAPVRCLRLQQAGYKGGRLW